MRATPPSEDSSARTPRIPEVRAGSSTTVRAARAISAGWETRTLATAGVERAHYGPQDFHILVSIGSLDPARTQPLPRTGKLSVVDAETHARRHSWTSAIASEGQ